MPFNWTSASTVVPYATATSNSVSPVCTVYDTGVAVGVGVSVGGMGDAVGVGSSGGKGVVVGSGGLIGTIRRWPTTIKELESPLASLIASSVLPYCSAIAEIVSSSTTM